MVTFLLQLSILSLIQLILFKGVCPLPAPKFNDCCGPKKIKKFHDCRSKNIYKKKFHDRLAFDHFLKMSKSFKVRML